MTRVLSLLAQGFRSQPSPAATLNRLPVAPECPGGPEAAAYPLGEHTSRQLRA
jgi:hypothetical protein